MTPQETTALIDRHLENWLGSDDPDPTLRERIAAMIAETEAARDKLWQSGNAVLRHERDVAQRVAREAQETNVQLEGMLRQAKEQIAALATARDDAVQAAHMIAEELAECKRRAGT